jgi:hypothetical protein
MQMPGLHHAMQHVTATTASFGSLETEGRGRGSSAPGFKLEALFQS